MTPDKENITYCRIGERLSRTWFVLKYLLGYPNVKKLYGSWTEWENMIANHYCEGELKRSVSKYIKHIRRRCQKSKLTGITLI